MYNKNSTPKKTRMLTLIPDSIDFKSKMLLEIKRNIL